MTSDNEPEGTSVNFYSAFYSFANRQWAFTVDCWKAVNITAIPNYICLKKSNVTRVPLI